MVFFLSLWYWGERAIGGELERKDREIVEKGIFTALAFSRQRPKGNIRKNEMRRPSFYRLSWRMQEAFF